MGALHYSYSIFDPKTFNLCEASSLEVKHAITSTLQPPSKPASACEQFRHSLVEFPTCLFCEDILRGQAELNRIETLIVVNCIGGDKTKFSMGV